MGFWLFSLILSRSHPDPHITSREQSVSGPLPVSGRITPVIRRSGIRQSTPRGLFPDSHTHSRLHVSSLVLSRSHPDPHITSREQSVSGPLPVSGRIAPVIRGSGIRQSTPRGLFPDSHTHSRLHVFSLVLSRSHPDPHITSREQSVSGPLPVSGRITPVIRGSGIRQSTPRGLFPDSHTHSRLRVCLTLSPCQSTAFLSDIYSSCTRSSSRRAC